MVCEGVILLFWISAIVGNLAAGQQVTCRDKCGEVEIRYPFGIDPGCGDPEHQLNCTNGHLTVSSGDVSNVTVVDITDETLMINTTNQIATFYTRGCTVQLSSSDYKVQQEETIFCFPSSAPQLPDEVLSGGCIFVKGVELHSYDLFWNCFNYTKRTQTTTGIWPSIILTYAEVPWNVRDDWKEHCDMCHASSGTCGYNTSDYTFLCINPRASSKSNTAVIGGAVGGGAALLLLLCLGGGCCMFKRKQASQRRMLILNDSKKSSASSKSQYLSTGSQSPIVDYHSTSHGNYFPLKELEEATDNFSESGRLGDGGFGTVYKGKLRDGRLVAVKKLNPWNAQGKCQFHNEVNILSQVTHPYLVKLYGCCSEGRELLLVYEFIANGTLYDHIHDRRAGYMDWDKRLTVVTETAEALAWLHTNVNPPIYHRDVKSTNILIDESYHAKVGDFGLSRLVPSLELTHITTAPQGTPGYLDPDYHQSYQLTDKSDVYSFGVVLMEIVSSQRAVDMSRDRKEINLAALAVTKIQCGQLDKLVDQGLGTEFDPVRCRMVEAVAELSFECLSAEKDDRPCMRDVASRLKNIGQTGKQEYVEQMSVQMQKSSGNYSEVKVSRSGVQPLNVESPTSVQMQWPSTHTSPNDSASSL